MAVVVCGLAELGQVFALKTVVVQVHVARLDPPLVVAYLFVDKQMGRSL